MIGGAVFKGTQEAKDRQWSVRWTPPSTKKKLFLFLIYYVEVQKPETKIKKTRVTPYFLTLIRALPGHSVLRAILVSKCQTLNLKVKSQTSNPIVKTENPKTL